MVDARLPDGSRVNAIIPPLALDGPSLSIRRFGTGPLTANQLVELKSISPEMMEVLAAAVRARISILISGGTGAGKTTLLNILSPYIPESERIITIEDAAELQLAQENLVRLETRPPNIEGQGAVRQRQLLINSLRMRPDRIIIGEVRGEEAFDMLQAMNTGHEGSMTTIHANTPRDALTRLESMVAMTNLNLPGAHGAPADRLRDHHRRSDLPPERWHPQGDQHLRDHRHGREHHQHARDLYVPEERHRPNGKVVGAFQPTRNPPAVPRAVTRLRCPSAQPSLRSRDGGEVNVRGLPALFRAATARALSTLPAKESYAADSAGCIFGRVGAVRAGADGGWRPFEVAGNGSRNTRFRTVQKKPPGDRRNYRSSQECRVSAIPWMDRLLARLRPAAELRCALRRRTCLGLPDACFSTGVLAWLVVFYVIQLKTGMPGISALLASPAIAAPFLYVFRKRRGRLDEFQKKLPNAIDLMVSALRAGNSTMGALGIVATEAPEPIRREFRACFDEQSYGVDMRAAMENLVSRVPLPDMRIIITAILIQKESGGNLAEVLDKTAHVIRDRFRLRDQIRVHSAQGRLTGTILSILPIAMGFFLFLVNPKYILVLLTNPIGHKLMACAGVMNLLGLLVIRRIIRIQV